MPLAETVARARADGKASKHSAGVEDRFHQLPHVVSARVGDATVLMDRKRGKYFTLNEVGGRVWELVGSGVAVSDMVEQLLEEYEAPKDKLEADVGVTLRQLVSDRLMAPGTRPVSGAPAKPAGKPIEEIVVSRLFQVPSVLRCGLMIFVTKALLKLVGLNRTIDWARRRVQNVPVGHQVDARGVQAAEQRVAMAGALYPGRALCLEQSFTLWYALRRMGVPAALRAGVRAHPFQAHAWVEVCGEIVNDIPERVSHFQAFESLLP